MVNHETSETTTVLDPATPGPITDAAMRDLVSWYNQEITECSWPLLIASEFRFLAIHPFQDGNERISRVRSFEKALDDIVVHREKFKNLQDLTEIESAVLGAFKASPEQKLRVSDIAEATSLNTQGKPLRKGGK